ncbi:MAG: glycosyltransferase [Rariglobus sp.]|nr:glycosyltransferase [Rariglobus sp.]
MKIAQIVASLESRHGGPSRSVLGLSSGLAALGHSVELLTTRENGIELVEKNGPLATLAFPRGWPRRFCPATQLRDHLQSRDHDLIHSHGLWLRPLHYARLVSERHSVPLVISPRGMMSPWAWNHHRPRKAFAARFIHPNAFLHAAGWHATSQAEADDIRRLGFTQPVCVAANGVTPPSPNDESIAARHWRETVPGLSGRRVALFYSRFHAKKRVLELIDLWLSKPRGDWVLLMVGIPEQYSVHQLDSYLLRNGGANHVFVRDGDGLPHPYAAASLFLLPSHSENFGQVVVEALVHGLPVLTTDGTPWSALDKEGAGRCVAWKDYGNALDALLASSTESLHSSGERARIWARAGFSWEQSASILADFYRQLRTAR